MPATTFDLGRLFHSIDAERGMRKLSWAALSREVGVSTSTIRRFGAAHDAEADGVLALVRWLGVPPEDYINSKSVEGERLRPPGDGYIRVDRELIAKAEGDPLGARGRTRTTIQALVEAAQGSGQPVASLTRFSDV